MKYEWKDDVEWQEDEVVHTLSDVATSISRTVNSPMDLGWLKRNLENGDTAYAIKNCIDAMNAWNRCHNKLCRQAARLVEVVSWIQSSKYQRHQKHLIMRTIRTNWHDGLKWLDYRQRILSGDFGDEEEE